MEISEVRIRNSENNTDYFFYLRTDKLRAFYQFLLANRKEVQTFGGMPGISGAAALGLTTIFFRMPGRFPAQDLLNWIRGEQKTSLGDFPNPTVQSAEVEIALGKFAEISAQLNPDGSDRV